MMKKYTIAILFLLLVTSTFFAQDKRSSQDVQNEIDSLRKMKQEFLELKQQYSALIDSLYSISLKLDTLISIEQYSIFLKKYGSDIGNKVATGMVWTGMTEEMLLDGWGEPDKSNTDRYSYGVFTQHVYGDIEFFFRDNKLIDWEQGSVKQSSQEPIHLKRK